MAYHHEWSQSYMKDYQLTFEEHHMNNEWFNGMLTLLNKLTMLDDLNKEEINYIVNVLTLNNSEIMNKEETQFSSNLYLKFRNLSTVCTCKEANQ